MKCIQLGLYNGVYKNDGLIDLDGGFKIGNCQVRNWIRRGYIVGIQLTRKAVQKGKKRRLVGPTSVRPSSSFTYECQSLLINRLVGK